MAVSLIMAVDAYVAKLVIPKTHAKLAELNPRIIAIAMPLESGFFFSSSFRRRVLGARGGTISLDVSRTSHNAIDTTIAGSYSWAFFYGLPSQ